MAQMSLEGLSWGGRGSWVPLEQPCQYASLYMTLAPGMVDQGGYVNWSFNFPESHPILNSTTSPVEVWTDTVKLLPSLIFQMRAVINETKPRKTVALIFIQTEKCENF